MEKKYPIGGYAPGNYQCKCCICGGGFIGDKRAVECEQCATRAREKFDMLSPQEQQERIKTNIQLANSAFSKLPIDSDASKYPPSFDEMVGLIKKLFTDYLEDVIKSKPSEIEKSWERFKTLNHLYQNNVELSSDIHDRIIAKQLEGMSLEKAIYEVGYADGIDFQKKDTTR